MRARRRLLQRLCLLAGALAGSAAVASPRPATAAPAASAGARPPEPAPVEVDADALINQGRALLKAHQYAAAVSPLRAAVVRAGEQHLPADTRAFACYLLGLAARGAQKDELAIWAFRQALKLSPGQPEFRLDLARAFLHSGRPQDARDEAAHGLLLGFSDGSDVSDAQALMKAARLAALRERLSIYLALSFGYDSNVLVGTTGLCGESNCTGSTRFPASLTNLGVVSRLRSHPTDTAAIAALYATPLNRREWDLPATIELELGGRPYGGQRVNLWYEYRFYQYLLPSLAFDHDGYNFQEHSLPVYLLWKPLPWLLLHPQIEGFVNFTGLRNFNAFQGGFRVLLDASFLESPRWSTRLLYINQLRSSFDRTNLSYLDGDRSDIKVLQELRLGSRSVRLRAQLSYRFRSEGSGVLDTRVPDPQNQVPLAIPAANNGAGMNPLQVIGGVDYQEATGYLGHEAALRLRLYAPAGLLFSTGVSYEYRIFDRVWSASVFHYPPATPQLMPFLLPVQQRRDQLVSFDFGVRKSLNNIFGIELTYALGDNFSTLANWLDNRNFSKHTVSTTFSYTF
jgi:hypothetical protein